jgi:hypothetical protein
MSENVERWIELTTARILNSPDEWPKAGPADKATLGDVLKGLQGPLPELTRHYRERIIRDIVKRYDELLFIQSLSNMN